MKFKKQLTEARNNVVWSSTGQRDYYWGMPIEELRSEVKSILWDEEEFVDRYDVSIDEADEEQLLDYLFPDDIDIDYEDFTESVMPMIEKQCKGNVLVLFGSAANWRGTREACAVIEPDEFKDYIYPRFEASSKICSENGNLYYTQATHDTPMGGTEMYLYSFKSDEAYDKAEEMMSYDDLVFGPEDWDYKAVGELIKAGLLTPVRNGFNENLKEDWIADYLADAHRERDNYQDFEEDSILDSLGSDYECVAAMYDMLGYNTDDEFFYETVEEDWDYGRLEIKSGKFILNKDGRTIMCSGRDSSNFTVVWEETNENLKEGKWNNTLKSGAKLRKAINKEDYQGVLDGIKACYKEMLDKGVIDEYDYDRWTEDFDFYDLDDEDIEDTINYELDNLYDACDELGCWVSLDESLKEDFFNDNKHSRLLKQILSTGVDDSGMSLETIENVARKTVQKDGYPVVVYLDLDGNFYCYHYYGPIDKWTKSEKEIIPIEIFYEEDGGFGDVFYEKNSDLVSITESIDSDQIKAQVEALTDDIDAFEGNGEKCYVTWNFGEDKDGNLTGGIDLNPHPSIEKDKEACEALSKQLIGIFEKNGFELDGRYKPGRGLFGSYHYQIIKKDELSEDIKRYSDVYDDETRQRGWWYFTTHGVQPGSIPKGLNVLEVRDGENKKGTKGTFVRLDGILNTSELKDFDMIELKPLEEAKTPYGDTTIEDYVEKNFDGKAEDKQKLVADMKKKANGKDYFNGLNMSVKDWEKAGQQCGLTMKKHYVTESKKLEEGKWSNKYPQYQYTFDDGWKITAVDENEAMAKYEDIQKNRYNGVRSKEELDDIAQKLYDKNDRWSFNYFSDDELAILWAMCSNPIFAPAYDDEVYDAIYNTPNTAEIFDLSKKYFKELGLDKGKDALHEGGDRAINKAMKDKDKIAKKYGVSPTSIVWMGGNKFVVVKDGEEIEVDSSQLTEDTIKTKDGKWTNKGDEGTHGKFKTKKEADAQRRAMFANGFREGLDIDYDPSIYEPRQRTALDGKTWWYPYNTKENKYSTLVKHGKYKTKKDCQYAIDNAYRGQ